MAINCPRCGYKIVQPTQRQIEAYRLVHIHGCTQEEAGKIMGIKKNTVSELLKRLKEGRKILSGQNPRFVWKKALSYDDNMTYDVKRRF